MKKTLLLISTSLLLISCSSNQIKSNLSKTEVNNEFNKALNHYDKREYEQAFKKWELLAKEGHAESAYRIADMYEFALGTNHSYSEAIDWYHFSAERGNIKAQFKLGNRYQSGVGVSKDYKEAYKWHYLCSKNKTFNENIKPKCKSSMSVYVSVFYNNNNFTEEIKEIDEELKNWKALPSL